MNLFGAGTWGESASIGHVGTDGVTVFIGDSLTRVTDISVAVLVNWGKHVDNGEWGRHGRVTA